MGVVSASHDQTLKVWTLSGECLAELVGHTALVYCAAATPGGLVASGSEDNTARLWHADGSCLQVGWAGVDLFSLVFFGRGGEGRGGSGAPLYDAALALDVRVPKLLFLLGKGTVLLHHP